MSDANSGRPVSGGEYSLAGRRVARIGFGTGQLSRLTGDADAAIAIVRRAVELGVNHIDTAQFYGAGFANEVLRIALRPDDGVLVATKVGADPDPDGPVPLKTAQRPERLRASVEDNLRSLSVERLELVNLRRLDVGPGVRASGEQVVDLDDQLAEMVAMRDEGLIGAIGISAVSLDGLRRALPARVACVQNAYSLASRAYEDLLEFVRGRRSGVGAVLPAGRHVRVHAQGGRTAGGRRDRSLARCDAVPGRTGLAAGPCTEHPAHPGDVEYHPPRAEPHDRRTGTGRRSHRRARRRR